MFFVTIIFSLHLNIKFLNRIVRRFINMKFEQMALMASLRGLQGPDFWPLSSIYLSVQGLLA
jgi:hypothetical protein